MAVVSPVEVQRHLSGVDYPATREQLINQAQKEGADERVLEALRKLLDKEYRSPAEVSKAIGDED
ncbi:DUF2795 domain-containing protein [Pseudonocardia sp. K10HN5]|uniref:DUF2795 domain-containing protein n=1 Tax=Pseudonocardia acidicola TaxID=2724939 RepID=A0ABX1S660_9PSEU|nr:DUF2795 domain-containing protein [Pseudonocardia acidicola]NMH97059.1 DUF2795 domain-containing protein [Pseudonocardia acidicola]